MATKIKSEKATQPTQPAIEQPEIKTVEQQEVHLTKRTRTPSAASNTLSKIAGRFGLSKSVLLEKIAPSLDVLAVQCIDLQMTLPDYLSALASPESKDGIQNVVIDGIAQKALAAAENAKRAAEALKARLKNPVSSVPCVHRPENEAKAENT